MKLHNPFKVASISDTPVLFLTLFVTGVIIAAILIAFLSQYPLFCIALFVAFVVGRVGYAIIKGK